MEERNNYKKLRFDNDTTWKPNISQRELADKIGLGFSTISKLEKEGCDTASVSTIKAYKEYFLKEKGENICYEYFMEETNTKEKKYYELGKLFPFDDTFYNNLTQLLELDKDNHFIEFMLSALLHNPHELFNALITIFNALHKINAIQHKKDLSVNEKNELIKMQEYIFNQATIEYLEETLMPILVRAFEWKNEQLANESTATHQEVDDIMSSEIIMPTSFKVNLVTPIDPIN